MFKQLCYVTLMHKWQVILISENNIFTQPKMAFQGQLGCFYRIGKEKPQGPMSQDPIPRTKSKTDTGTQKFNAVDATLRNLIVTINKWLKWTISFYEIMEQKGLLINSQHPKLLKFNETAFLKQRVLQAVGMRRPLRSTEHPEVRQGAPGDVPHDVAHRG